MPGGMVALSLIALTVPVFEEAYYRGFLYSALQNKVGLWAVPIVALWFCVPHTAQVVGDWIALPVIAAMGLIWTIQRHITGSITLPMITHFTYNATLVIVSMVWPSP
jgi:membrane protease YdiL (CAAX protease family)